MNISDFPTFYKEIHGYSPFPWQEKLLERVASYGWPATIDLPTSSGKTSAIDIAVFHLALEGCTPNRKAPLRIFFIIDRRVVVDQAAAHSLKIARALLNPKLHILMEAAERLKGFGADLPLAVSVLRGGTYRDNTWADEPNQPLVCLSTVDQVGSRLLFRGYQVGSGSRPVHAALVANDSLLIVDEAHLSNPFLETLTAVKDRFANESERDLTSGFQVVRMSATVSADTEPFLLQEEDRSHTVLGPRLRASKLALLRVPKNRFEDEVVQAAKERSQPSDCIVTGVVLNTVASAREVFEKLGGKSKAVLFIGRNRPYSARIIWDTYKDRIEATAAIRPTAEKLFVVATQTVEVGANLDFDSLVTESAPLDSLRQRFGRLNRMGHRTVAHASIVRRPKEDPIYGKATEEAWNFLAKQAVCDFGVFAMEKTLTGVDAESLSAKKESAPLLFPAHMELWAQTNPAPTPDPDVAPFLHGPGALDAADVQIVWRQDLTPGEPESWEPTVALTPPVALEALSMPIGAVKRWLREESADATDVEGLPVPFEETKKKPKKMRPVLIWRGPDFHRNSTDPYSIRPGDTIVVPSVYGGCDEFGWNAGSIAPVPDIGDEANNQLARAGMRPFRRRVAMLGIESEVAGFFDDDGRRPDKSDEDWQALKRKHDLGTNARLDASQKVFTWKGKKSASMSDLLVRPSETDEDDSASVGQDTRAVGLSEHTQGVRSRAKVYAERCGLALHIVEDIALAADLHDVGKWDRRFQAMLHGEPFWNEARYLEPLAKSGGLRTNGERAQLRDRAEYPKGARHEVASVMLAQCDHSLQRAHDRDLVLYLIGTHHGFGRPLLPVWDEPDDEIIEAQIHGRSIATNTGRHLARFGSGWVDRFWALNNRYGYWGLAYLETILRRADCVQSRKEQESE